MKTPACFMYHYALVGNEWHLNKFALGIFPPAFLWDIDDAAFYQFQKSLLDSLTRDVTRDAYALRLLGHFVHLPGKERR